MSQDSLISCSGIVLPSADQMSCVLFCHFWLADLFSGFCPFGGKFFDHGFKILGELAHSLFFGSPGGDEAHGGVGFIDLFLVLELIGLAESGDQAVGQDGKLLVGGGIREEWESAPAEGLF